MPKLPFDPPTFPRRWTPRHARAALDAWESSGLSLAAFSRRHGLHPRRLGRWRSRLDGSPDIAPAALPRLVELTVGAPSRPQQREPFVIELPGVRVQVPPVFEPEALADLVAVVRC